MEGPEEENDLEAECKIKRKLRLLVSLPYASVIPCTADRPSPREQYLCSTAPELQADPAAGSSSSTQVDASESRHLGPQCMALIS